MVGRTDQSVGGTVGLWGFHKNPKIVYLFFKVNNLGVHIDNKPLKKRELQYLPMFPSQQHTVYKETKWFKIALKTSIM